MSLIKLSYNNSHNSSIGIAPFEALYGRRCRSSLGQLEVDEITLIGPKLVCEAIDKVWLVRERSKTEKSWQKSNVDVRKMDLEFKVNY